MNWPKITIAGQDYRLKRTPPGQNGCHLCALILWCYDNADNMPCVDFAIDCHFIKENNENHSIISDSDNYSGHCADDGNSNSTCTPPIQR